MPTVPLPTYPPKRHAPRLLARTLVLLAGLACVSVASAGSCVVQNGRPFGSCETAQAGPAQPVAVFGSGSYSGNFGRVVIRRGAVVSLSGNSDRIIVEPGATLYFSGNTGGLQVWGLADLTGNVGRVVVHGGGTAVVRGVAQEVVGPGRVIAEQGSVIGGVPMN